MTGDPVAEIAAREVEEMGGCVLPTESGMRAAFEWLAEQEGVRRDWYAEEVPTILNGIDAARRVLAEVAALRGRLAAVEAAVNDASVTYCLNNSDSIEVEFGVAQVETITPMMTETDAIRAALATGEGGE